MSSSTMHEPLAIRLQNVSKQYKLHGSQRDQLIDVLGLQRFGIRPKTAPKEFSALSNISLEVPRGHRIGIVGRNGAGKTTLLKLICGNFAPTHGEVEVNGSVQALMNVGLGFHPEYTGRENVEASLQYNGLGREEYQEAIEGIIDFCELGDFLDQPFKTYSLGMQARLMFAAATAIRPDILIVDEVLGAGDAYFVAKSKTRVEKLVNSGCTMLLVSHSMQQVLELCDEAIWLDQGQIRMQAEAFLVVKAYEEYLHGPITALPNISIDSQKIASVIQATENETEQELEPSRLLSRLSDVASEIALQEPHFFPHATPAKFPVVPTPLTHSFAAPGGISRWDSVQGLKILGATIVNERGESNRLICMKPAKIIMTLVSESSQEFNCRYAIAVYDHLGRCVLDIVSPEDKFYSLKDELRTVNMILNPLQLGPGEYTVSMSIHQYDALPLFNSTPRYDLISRSMLLTVELPDTLATIAAQFYHSAEWNFVEQSIVGDV